MGHFKVFLVSVPQGFCLPAEYSDEMVGEGATDFEDIEGGGIGDGEGTKDVSDQIENEDQVRIKFNTFQVFLMRTIFF